jgi:hypothetical protein
MNHFNYLPEFQKELNGLLKKYRSLNEDIRSFEKVILSRPIGAGKNFTIIYSSKDIKIVKVRLMCKFLRNRNIRVIYAYHNNSFEFMYIEIYFKGDKENEDKMRVKEYLAKFK